MAAAELAPSVALLEANRRLYELREKAQADRASAVGRERPPATNHRSPNPGCQSNSAPRSRSLLGGLPDHLGWESAAVTANLKGDQKRHPGVKDHDKATSPDGPPLSPATKPPPAGDDQRPVVATVKLYPDIALGILRKEMAAAGRIWLLLRYADLKGQGWLPVSRIQEELTAKNSELRVCGRRQLRNLLRQGGGVFWEQDRERIWLKSAAKVAEALGVERLTGRSVELPVEVLLGGIRQVRAHFYASFHSGRRSNNPISRAKLAQLTSVPVRTQRSYESATGVTGRRNIAVGERYSQKEVQEQAWQRGHAAFTFVDANGLQGPAGQRYIAWQLPNSYEGCHATSPKGRQKKINHQIDLVNIGAQGNDLDREIYRQPVDRLFHPNGLEAGKSYNQNGQDDAFWPASAPRTLSKSSQVWQVIPGRSVR